MAEEERAQEETACDLAHNARLPQMCKDPAAGIRDGEDRPHLQNEEQGLREQTRRVHWVTCFAGRLLRVASMT
jgi:hypothetical protein